MGNAVAVTRNGLGDFWMFSSASEADLHPLIQYGDVICDSPASILRKYTRLEIPDLLRRLGDEEFRSEVLMRAAGPLGWHETMSRYSDRMWQKMQECAAAPPADPREIVSLITRDRKLSLGESRVQPKEKTMSNTEQTATAEATEPKAKKEKATPTTIGGFSLASTITMLVDKDGNPYGKDNNPKKAGSKSAVRFEAYGNGGITVEEAYKAGVSAADFAYDVNKGFIKID